MEESKKEKILRKLRKLMNLKESALLLCISESRIRHLTSEREIPYYKKGNMVFFKKSEIEKWQLSNRIPTNDEIKSKATTYAVLNK